jgi:molecular chaperone GrpE
MLFRKRRMKQDDKIKTGNHTDLDSVPFPDDKKDDGHRCCHGHGEHEGKCCHSEGDEESCECQHEGEGKDACSCGCQDDGTQGNEEAQAEVLARIDAITTENAALREMLVRATADFDNFRKRVVREKEDARKMANADLVTALIPVLDTMALATASARTHHPEASAILDGIDMVVSQLRNVLKANGVEEIAPTPGSAFDPNMHESITKQPSDTVEEGQISTVVRIGYTLNGRLIRAAGVILSSGKAK